jgi:hypothetical protein
MVVTRFTQTVAELDAPPRVWRWKTAWESRDPDPVSSPFI